MEWRLPSQFSKADSTSDLYTNTLSRSPSGSHSSFLETSIGLATLILSHQLRLGHKDHASSSSNLGGTSDGSNTHDPASEQPERTRRISSKDWSTCAHLIKHALRVALEEALDDDGCEVLYGRAGLLYSLLFLRSELVLASEAGSKEREDPVVKVIEPLCSDENIRALVNDLVTRGQFGAEVYKEALKGEERDRAPPLMWRWHGKRYLGAAHGVGRSPDLCSIHAKRLMSFLFDAYSRDSADDFVCPSR